MNTKRVVIAAIHKEESNIGDQTESEKKPESGIEKKIQKS